MPVKRYETNPFYADMLVPVKQRQVQLSRLGKDNNIIINESTGETQGTAITTYRKVDSEQFVKIFTSNIKLIFELTAAGNKAFTVLLWTVQNQALSKDVVILDVHTLDKFMKHQSDDNLKLSRETFKRGLSELTKAQIIARTLRQGVYFINPNFVFNGDRIAFTTLIERSDTHNDDQQEMEI